MLNVKGNCRNDFICIAHRCISICTSINQTKHVYVCEVRKYNYLRLNYINKNYIRIMNDANVLKLGNRLIERK